MPSQTNMVNTEPKPVELPSESDLKQTSRQRLRKEAKVNRKKMNSEMKTLARPLKVGEFIQYTRQQEGVFGFIHKFLQEMHPDEYKSFIERIQKEEAQRKNPASEEIEHAELEESLETAGEAVMISGENNE